jgi:hypothetical protein
MPHQSIISPTQGRWLIAVLLMLLTVTPSTANAYLPNISAGASAESDYKDKVLGSGRGDGDVWGGEQAVPREPVVDLIPTKPVELQMGLDQAFWLVRLASLFAWFRSSLWFPNLD